MNNSDINYFPVEHYPCNVKQTVLVSVVVVTYNHEEYIEQCLESILSQETTFDFEIILGEDDSADNTREICIGLASKYRDKIRLLLHNRKNVICIDEKPTGRFNFLFGLKQAKGKYIALCDGDDYWESRDKLQRQVEFLDKNPSFSGVFHDTKISLGNNLTSNKFRTYNKDVFIMNDCISERILFHTSSILYRNELNTPNWLKTITSGDFGVSILIGENGKIKCLKNIYSVYRRHSGGITNTLLHLGITFHKNRISFWKVIRSYLNRQHRNQCEQVIAYHQYYAFQSSLSQSNILIVISNFVGCLKYWCYLKPFERRLIFTSWRHVFFKTKS